MLIGLPDFSCFKIFIFQCFKPVISFVVQELDPPTTPYIFKRQPQKAHQLSLLLQAALVQINEGLYFCSPRLATRFESNAANIAIVLFPQMLTFTERTMKQEKGELTNCQTIKEVAFGTRNK